MMAALLDMLGQVYALLDRREEALSTARPACDAIKDGPLRKLLDDRRLCGT